MWPRLLCLRRSSLAVTPSLPWLHVWLQLVGADDDGKLFDEQDAQLDLSAGQPRCPMLTTPAGPC